MLAQPLMPLWIYFDALSEGTKYSKLSVRTAGFRDPGVGDCVAFMRNHGWIRRLGDVELRDVLRRKKFYNGLSSRLISRMITLVAKRLGTRAKGIGIHSRISIHDRLDLVLVGYREVEAHRSSNVKQVHGERSYVDALQPKVYRPPKGVKVVRVVPGGRNFSEAEAGIIGCHNVISSIGKVRNKIAISERGVGAAVHKKNRGIIGATSLTVE